MRLQEQHGYQKQQVTLATAGTLETAGTLATAGNTGNSGDAKAAQRK